MSKKKGYPTECKGIFYDGFKKGQKEGKTMGERSMQTVSASKSKGLTAENMRKHQASKPLTESEMRKPFG